MIVRFARATALATIFAVVFGVAVTGPARADDAQIARGDYLARIMDCTGCHTPGTMSGKPDMTKYLAGGDIGFEIPGLGIFWPPNLTSDEATGIGSWTAEDVAHAVRTGETPDGRILAPIMPYMSYATLSDEDAMALGAYIKSLAPISNPTPDPVGGPAEATAPYLTVAVPVP